MIRAQEPMPAEDEGFLTPEQRANIVTLIYGEENRNDLGCHLTILYLERGGWFRPPAKPKPPGVWTYLIAVLSGLATGWGIGWWL